MMRTTKPHEKLLKVMGLLLIGIYWPMILLAQAQNPTFYSILTKDKTRLNPVTSFSLNDKIYLHTIWKGVEGDHEIKVLWIRPDKTVQEIVRFTVKIPPNAQNYTTWAYLFFKKSLLNLSSIEEKFIGPWKARLFLDEKFMAEYGFSVS